MIANREVSDGDLTPAQHCFGCACCLHADTLDSLYHKKSASREWGSRTESLPCAGCHSHRVLHATTATFVVTVAAVQRRTVHYMQQQHRHCQMTCGRTRSICLQTMLLSCLHHNNSCREHPHPCTCHLIHLHLIVHSLLQHDYSLYAAHLSL